MKHTLTISSPGKLHLAQRQLVYRPKDSELPPRQHPISELALLLLDHPQLTCTLPLLAALAEEGVGVIICSPHNHLPLQVSLPLAGHHLPSARLRMQVAATPTCKAACWQAVVKAKLTAQAELLEYVGAEAAPLHAWAAEVQPADRTQRESAAASYYWSQLLGPHFTRRRCGVAPNSWLNYGYAILRAATARALVAAGLHPTLGIHHHHKNNALCLADDMMEPYRVLVDGQVWALLHQLEPLPLHADPPKKALLPLLHARLATADGQQIGLQHELSRMAQQLCRMLAGVEDGLGFALPILPELPLTLPLTSTPAYHVDPYHV